MRYCFDTEFLEDGRTIELISIGVVAENGREFYAVNRDAPWRRIKKHAWLVENVVPSLPNLHGDARLHYSRRGPLGIIDWQSPLIKRRQTIADQLLAFFAGDTDVKLWADYCAYDHVALCQLYGPMIALPDGFPMWTHDFQQAWENAGKPELPEQSSGAHNALADARHLMACLRLIELTESPS